VQADQILRQRAGSNSYYHDATVFVDITDPVVNEFLRERIGIAGANSVMTRAFQRPSGAVRYFRDSQPEESR